MPAAWTFGDDGRDVSRLVTLDELKAEWGAIIHLFPVVTSRKVLRVVSGRHGDGLAVSR